MIHIIMIIKLVWIVSNEIILFLCIRRICEMLLIKDTSLIPNILWFEYKNARLEARSRVRKGASSKLQWSLEKYILKRILTMLL